MRALIFAVALLLAEQAIAAPPAIPAPKSSGGGSGDGGDAGLLDGIDSLGFAQTTTMSGASVTCPAGVGVSTLVLNPSCAAPGAIVFAPLVNNDADGCDVTMSEAAAQLGCQVIVSLAASAGGVVTIADVATVADVDGLWTPAVGDNLALVYQDRADPQWQEEGRNRSWNPANDGPGSGLNADLCDGRDCTTLADGSGVATEVTFWTDANTIASDAGMTYVAATDTLTTGTFSAIGSTSGVPIFSFGSAGTTGFGFDGNQVEMIRGGIVTAAFSTGIFSSNVPHAMQSHVSFTGIAAPAASDAGRGRAYFDSTSNTLKLSQNTGAYFDFCTTNNCLPLAGGTMTGAITFNGVATDITTGTNEDLTLSPNGTGRIVNARSVRTTGTATAVLTGSIDPTASTAVVGVGTLFTTQLVLGDRITVSGETRTVTAITDNTNLTVDSAFSDNANDASPDALYAIQTMRDSAGALKLTVNDLGLVGINEPAPVAFLHVESTATPAIRVDADNFEWIFQVNNAATGLQRVGGGFSFEEGNALLSIVDGGGGPNTTTVSSANARHLLLRANAGDATKGVIVQSASGQTAPLTLWRNDAGTSLASVNIDGKLLAASVSAGGVASIADIGFINDTDTGFYFRTANVFGWMSGGTHRGFFGSDGALIINGSDQVTSAAVVNGVAPKIEVLSGLITATNPTAGTDGEFDMLRLRGGDAAGARTNIRFLGDSNAKIASIVAVTKTQGVAGHLTFETSEAADTLVERMRVDSNGNVGINKTIPTEKLDVVGNIGLPTTTSTVGKIIVNGNRFLHNFGSADNVFLGRNAGNLTLTGTPNTGLGTTSLFSVTSGSSNVAVGTSALQDLTTGTRNTAVGTTAMSLSNGTSNTAVGFSSMNGVSVGNDNTAIGDGAAAGTGGYARLVAIGRLAGFAVTTGNDNTFIGYSSGDTSTTNTDITLIGSDSDVSSATGLTNSTAIGANAIASASNTVQLGDTSVTLVNTSGGIAAGGNISQAASTFEIITETNLTVATTTTPTGSFQRISATGAVAWTPGNTSIISGSKVTACNVDAESDVITMTDGSTYEGDGVALGINDCVMMVYDGTTTKWRQVGKSDN